MHEVTSDPLFAGFLLDYMTGEAIPTLRAVPGVDLAGYAHQLIERFSNPEVRDTVARLCANASDLIPKFLLPVIRDQLAAGRPVTRAAAVVATWARYAEGTDENGEPHELDDDLAPQLRAAARGSASSRPRSSTDNRAVFGELADEPRFTRVYTAILGSLIERGVRETYADLDRFADRPVFEGPVLEDQRDHATRRRLSGPDRGRAADVPAPAPGRGPGPHARGGRVRIGPARGPRRHPSSPLPYRPGHEVVGIVETGAAGPSGCTPGQRVIVEPDLPCWTARCAPPGGENLCENLQFFGCGYPQGGMADFFTLPRTGCTRCRTRSTITARR